MLATHVALGISPVVTWALSMCRHGCEDHRKRKPAASISLGWTRRHVYACSRYMKPQPQCRTRPDCRKLLSEATSGELTGYINQHQDFQQHLQISDEFMLFVLALLSTPVVYLKDTIVSPVSPYIASVPTPQT